MLSALLAEPPFRRLMQLGARVLPVSVRTRDRWNAADRPAYLAGVLYAADQAAREGRDRIAVIEFGVAEGYGLLVLERHAAAVERETGIKIAVYGFDGAAGLPRGTGDYRDHPDWWQAGDYRMDVDALRAQLDPRRTTLVLGQVKDTATRSPIAEPLGFISMDLDLYSSTTDALAILIRHDVARLKRVSIYLDDAGEHYNHRWAGELLAIDRFNAESKSVKIDRWRGVRAGRPFHEAVWLDAMYMAHDLEAISATRLTRPLARMR